MDAPHITPETIRISSGLRAMLDDIAREESKSLNELFNEGAWLVINSRQRPKPDLSQILPVFGNPNGPVLSTEGVQRLIDESEDEYYERKLRVALDRPA